MSDQETKYPAVPEQKSHTQGFWKVDEATALAILSHPMDTHIQPHHFGRYRGAGLEPTQNPDPWDHHPLWSIYVSTRNGGNGPSWVKDHPWFEGTKGDPDDRTYDMTQFVVPEMFHAAMVAVDLATWSLMRLPTQEDSK